MNNNATTPHQNARPLHSRYRITVVRRRVIRPVPYRLHLLRQSILSNRAANQAPLTLTQPHTHEVDVEAFNRMWPELGGAPPRFVRDALLRVNGKQMLQNARNTEILEYFNQEEPEECEVLFKGPFYDDNVVPTHILAVGQGRDVQLFPVHEIIFAANCATLPNFPYSSNSIENSSDQFTLPVVKFEVPSIDSFHVLHEYLYTKNVNILQRALTLRPYARTLANLYRQTAFIRGLWRNACTLCVVDISLYIVMQDLYVRAQNAISRFYPM